MKQLKLSGMLKALAEQQQSSSYSKLSFEDRLGYLVDAEFLERGNKRLTTRLKTAKLKHNACIANVEYGPNRNLDKKFILSLAQCQWIKEHKNILITGLTGVGKSYLACALAHKGCLDGHSAFYIRAPKLFSDLALARGDGRYPKLMAFLSKIDVLIIDDWGLSKLNEQERKDFLEITEDRYDVRSTIITSQIPVKQWHELIGNATFADATLDRLVHNSYRIVFDGSDSMRKNKKEKPEEKK